MSELNPSLTCKNCSATVTDQYCAQCGQARSTNRITYRRIASELVEQVISMDAKFLRTVHSLTLRPGHFIREYLLGQRRPYIKPLQFYLVMLALFFVFSELLQVDPMEAGRKISEGMQPEVVSSAKKQIQEKVQQTLSSNTRVIFSIMVLIQALSLWLVYYKRAWHFVEWVVFSLFLFGYQYFFSLFLPLAAWLLGYHTTYYLLTSVVTLVSVTYSVWSIKQFVQVDGIGGWLRALAAVLLTYAFFFFFSALIGIVLGLLVMFPNGK
jgi:cation transport ATPase